MISDKQRQANRANAQKSTGPKTEIGKTIASKNAAVHGLRSAQPVIDGEDLAEYNGFRNEMIFQFKPIGLMEILLVDRIVHSVWRLRRIGTIEVQLYDYIRRTPEDEQSKMAEHGSERTQALRIPHISKKIKVPPPSRMRFSSFKEAVDAWNKSQDGILHAKGQWATEPGSPTPNDSFGKFIRQPAQSDSALQLPLQQEDAEFSSATDKARSQEPAEIYSSADCRPEPQPLPLGRAVANDMKGPGLLCRLSRYETAIERSMFKNLRHLQTLQTQRQGRRPVESPDILKQPS